MMRLMWWEMLLQLTNLWQCPPHQAVNAPRDVTDGAPLTKEKSTEEFTSQEATPVNQEGNDAVNPEGNDAVNQEGNTAAV